MLNRKTKRRLVFFALLCPLFLSQSMALEADLRQCGFIFLRHGQTDDNVKKVIQGTRNTMLNEIGKKEAEKAGCTLFPYRLQIKRIVSSPLVRAHETSEIVAQKIEFQGKIELDDRFKERCRGDWEGMLNTGEGTHADLREGEAPNGENQVDFYARIHKGLLEIVTEPGVLIVSHGGVLNAVSLMMGLGPRRIQNAVPLFIYREGDIWKFHELNKEGDFPPLPEAWYTCTHHD